MNDRVFSSSRTLRQAFNTGLGTMLEGGGLGPFILVCANAGFDPEVQAATGAALKRHYQALRDDYLAALGSGREIRAVEEDLLVFLKLHAVGLDKLQPTEKRRAGPWEVQFNHLRSFRPKRIAARIPESLRVPFDESGFNFNKPFMQKEAFWSGPLGGRDATLYYNKYPFVELHALLVPQREARLPQFLDQERFAWLWATAEELAPTLDGVGFGYNALGAYASVNHLHFQMFVKPEGFPVQAANWRHNGGAETYPAACAAFDDRDEAWAYLDHLHDDNTAYNLLCLPGRAYVFARRRQGTYGQPEWTTGFTWHELAGGMLTFNRGDFDSLDEATIRQALQGAAHDGP